MCDSAFTTQKEGQGSPLYMGKRGYHGLTNRYILAPRAVSTFASPLALVKFYLGSWHVTTTLSAYSHSWFKNAGLIRLRPGMGRMSLIKRFRHSYLVEPVLPFRRS